MQELDSAFMKRIRRAVARGQVVLVSPPAAHVSAAPPPRETALTATLCLLFKLSRIEGRILSRLMASEYATSEELHTAISHGGSAATLKSLKVFIMHVRKKLAVHGIKIVTIWGIGYSLDKDSRAQIRELLAGHDASLSPELASPEHPHKQAIAEE